MATRIVEGKKPYTGGKAISIDENKVISLNLREENNLIIYDEGDDEIYVDLQLDDEITPTSAFPIGVNVGRVIVDNGWDKPGTIISAETTSGDNIKIFYADEGTLWIDNGTGTFKQIYFKADVDALLLALRNYIDGELAKKQNGVSSDTAPSNPSEGDLWYDTTNSAMKVWDGTAWQSVGTGGGGSDIEYVTQAEYNALLPGALTDNKHYFIYSTSEWQPGVNTLAYRPLKADLSDYSGNGHDFVDSVGTTTFSNNMATVTRAICDSNFMNGYQGDYTILAYTDRADVQTCFFPAIQNHGYPNCQFGIDINGIVNYSIAPVAGSWYHLHSPSAVSAGVHLIAVTKNSAGGILYVDGVQVATSNDNFSFMNDTSRPIQAWLGQNVVGVGTCTFGNIIIENKVRTAQEVADYFNQTKANYGIS